MKRLLNTLENFELSWLYIDLIGYNPFKDGATSRDEVIETLITYPDVAALVYSINKLI